MSAGEIRAAFVFYNRRRRSGQRRSSHWALIADDRRGVPRRVRGHARQPLGQAVAAKLRTDDDLPSAYRVLARSRSPSRSR